MNLVVNRRLRVEQNIISHVRRSFLGSSKILVQVGQEVHPDTLVGKSTQSSGFHKINVAKVLQVNHKEAKKYLQRSVGQKIFKGELLALKPAGLLEKEKYIIAPADGIIDFFDEDSGELKLTFSPKNVDLPAAVYGIVDKVDNFLGEVMIRTEATRIHGVFGSGAARGGVLQVLSSRDILSASRIIPAAFSESIVVGGGLVYKDAIAAAIECGLKGIITGGINAKDFKGMSGGGLTTGNRLGTDVGLSIMVTEGFGSIPVGIDLFEILLKYQNRFVILDGNRARLSLPSYNSDCLLRIRKTRLPLDKESLVEKTDELEALELKIGSKVRVIDNHVLGIQGEVVLIDNTATLLKSGIRVNLVTVETKTKKVRVPYSNLEIVG